MMTAETGRQAGEETRSQFFAEEEEQEKNISYNEILRNKNAEKKARRTYRYGKVHLYLAT